MEHRAARPAARPRAGGVAGPQHARLTALSATLNAAAPVQRLAAMAPPNRTGLPDQLKAGIETLSGVSLDAVRVHRNSPAPAQLQALAYAQGRDIHLGPGQERHLPHEAWHVVQQAQGRVRPTRQLKARVAVNEDDRLEREADAMGAQALAGPTAPLAAPAAHRALQAAVVQGVVVQRQPVQLKVDGKIYPADWAAPWVKFTPQGATAPCRLYIGKSVDYVKGTAMFVARAHVVPYIKDWLSGSLTLYRGVDLGHKVYAAAKQGKAPSKGESAAVAKGVAYEKPDPEQELPDFTSKGSTTEFIPFSTSREVALMGTKNSSEEGESEVKEREIGADTEIGVLLRIAVGPAHAIGIFDEGEMQVLGPPQAEVIPVTGTTLHYNQRLDRAALSAETILSHLHQILDDPAWAQRGVGWRGAKKVPDGIARMKALLAKNEWAAVLRLATEKQASKDSDRHPQTSEAYFQLSVLRKRATDAGLMGGAPRQPIITRQIL